MSSEVLLDSTSTTLTADSPTINSPRQYQYTPRMVSRSDGRSRVRHRHLPPRGYLGYIKDSFTSIMDSGWYIIILLFFALYILSWLFFGIGWTILAYSYSSNETCVTNVNDFQSAFLFSLETQTTIGYGFRYPSSACGVGTLLLVIQSVVGLILDSFLLGLVFAKLSRPRNRRKTIIFSDYAVIHNKKIRRAKPTCNCNHLQQVVEEMEIKVLEFRIADVRRSQVVEAHVRLQLYWYRESGDGQCDLQQYDLDVGFDTGRDRVFLLTPVTVYHLITEDSPLYRLTQQELASSRLELVVILEGIVEATGLTAQALWSYTRNEILFNHWFESCSYYSSEKGEWVVDYSKLSSVL